MVLLENLLQRFRTKEQFPFKSYGIYVLVIHLYNFKEVALYILCKNTVSWVEFQDGIIL